MITDPIDQERPGLADWVSLALICASAAFSALLELLFLARFYVGTVIVPLVVLVAVVGNAALSAWGFSIARSTRGAVLPLAGWLLVVLGLSLYTRPEGDLFVINAYHEQAAFYALLLLGAGAGFATTIVLSGRAARALADRPTPRGRPPAPRPSPSAKSSANRPTKGPRVTR
jgi:hypothetical protein